MKPGRRLFGKGLSNDEVMARFIQDLIKRCFPSGETPAEKGNAPETSRPKRANKSKESK
jgi:hypothetical protein